MAQQRIKSPVSSLSLFVINQLEFGIVLSQLLGVAHVQMQEKRGLVGEEEPVSYCLQWTAVSIINPMTRGPAAEGERR